MLLLCAQAPAAASQGCATALAWVNTLPDEARRAILKHSQQVDRQFQLLAAAPQQMLSQASGLATRKAAMAHPVPSGSYHLLEPQMHIVQAPSCWSCRPKVSDTDWEQMRDAERRKQLAEAGHAMPEARAPVLPAPAYQAHIPTETTYATSSDIQVPGITVLPLPPSARVPPQPAAASPAAPAAAASQQFLPAVTQPAAGTAQQYEAAPVQPSPLQEHEAASEIPAQLPGYIQEPSPREQLQAPVPVPTVSPIIPAHVAQQQQGYVSQPVQAAALQAPPTRVTQEWAPQIIPDAAPAVQLQPQPALAVMPPSQATNTVPPKQPTKVSTAEYTHG